MTRPLLTQNGVMVPENYVRLSHVMVVGQAVPKVVHLYAHPYMSLAMGDLLRYLSGVVQELRMGPETGCFGITSLGSEISLCQVGGVLPDFGS